MGVPMIGCRCAVCRSSDPRDKRWRPSVLVRPDAGGSVLIDTSSDFRAQALAFDVTRVDAVLFTHSHADHVLGLDELRRFNTLQGEAVPLYGDERTLKDLRRIFDYAFQRPESGHEYVPQLTPFVIGGRFCLLGTEIVPIPIVHGVRKIFGFRIGGFAYLTDCSAIPEDSYPMLEGLDVLVLSALRERPHPSHLSLQEAIDAANRVGARETYFTHMCHDLGHAATCARLPRGMALAHDGLTLTL